MVRVGFIGLGNMGGPMAANVLKAGYALCVHDIRAEAATPLLESGASWGESPRAVAQASDVVLTSLPGPREVEAVALGEEGIIRSITPGAVYIDLSTSAPALTRRIHRLFHERGSHVIEAPLRGSPAGAQVRRLVILASGEEVVFQRSKPLLWAMARVVKYCGPLRPRFYVRRRRAAPKGNVPALRWH